MIAVIINVIEERVLNVNKIAQKFNNNDNYYVLFVCQFTNEKLKKSIDKKKLPKNIYFLFSKKKSLSYCKNMGISYFNKLKNISYLWFLDDDCEVKKPTLKKLESFILKNNFYFYVVHIFCNNKKVIGRNLKLLNFSTFFVKYLVGGPSIIVRKSEICKKYDLNFGYGGVVKSAEDTKFLIDNNFSKIKVLPKNIYITHIREKYNKKKVQDYSFGQGYLCGKIKSFDFLIFTILILYRPLIGVIFYTLIFNLTKLSRQINRIKYFFRGVKYSLEQKNIID